MNREGIEIKHDLFCQQCGYNLRTLRSARCPECGHSLETVRTNEPQIPWGDRAKLGWLRAYWKTVRLAMFNQRRFCEEMARTVSYADAQRFRYLTILHAYAPLLVVTVTCYLIIPQRANVHENIWITAARAVWPVAAFHAGIMLWLVTATGTPSYFFHPRDVAIPLQNRAIALSYYACGPLALTAIPALAALASVGIGPISNTVGMGLLLFALVFPLVGQLGVWWLDLIHIARRILPQRPERAALVAAAVPLIWLGEFMVIGLGLPASLIYILLVLTSLS